MPLSKMTSLILVALLSAPAMAASEGHHGSPSVWDLKFPFVNAFIFFAILYLALRKPVANHFRENSKSIGEIFNRAQVKAKEAQLRLQKYQQKLASAESEQQKILRDAEQEAAQLEKITLSDAKARAEKIKSDAGLRAERERQVLLDQVKESLVEDVVAKTKQLVASNQANRDKIAKRFLQEVR